MSSLSPKTVRVEHEAAVVWRGDVVGWVCTCGSSWPCHALLLADDAGRRRAQLARSTAGQVRP
jgi:hypothetical protein